MPKKKGTLLMLELENSSLDEQFRQAGALLVSKTEALQHWEQIVAMLGGAPPPPAGAGGAGAPEHRPAARGLRERRQLLHGVYMCGDRIVWTTLPRRASSGEIWHNLERDRSVSTIRPRRASSGDLEI